MAYIPYILRMLSTAGVLVMPATAHAYIGPGVGITAIGSLIALIVVLLLALVGFFWLPIKRRLKEKKSGESANADNER